jgi:pyrimidine nucleoside phosphorylase-like protein
VVTAVDVRAVGLAVIELAGGRARASDAIDPSVGFTDLAPIGVEVGPQAPLARVHARSATTRKPPRVCFAPPIASAMRPRTSRSRPRACRGRGVRILLVVGGWDPSPWRRRSERLLPSHPAAILGEPFDRGKSVTP